MRPLVPALWAGLAAALAVGCSDPKAPSEDNFARALKPALERHPYCVLAEVLSWPSPVTTEHPAFRSPTRIAQLDALAQAGLLRSEPRVVDTGRPVRDLLISELLQGARHETVKDTVTDYHWTEAGDAALGDRGLCFGTPYLEKVVRWTEPAEFMGAQVSEVTYSFSVHDVPNWASHPAIHTALPAVATAVAGPQEGKATLVLTNDGWRVME